MLCMLIVMMMVHADDADDCVCDCRLTTVYADVDDMHANGVYDGV